MSRVHESQPPAQEEGRRVQKETTRVKHGSTCVDAVCSAHAGQMKSFLEQTE